MKYVIMLYKYKTCRGDAMQNNHEDPQNQIVGRKRTNKGKDKGLWQEMWPVCDRERELERW
jgi:hypothetical protein